MKQRLSLLPWLAILLVGCASTEEKVKGCDGVTAIQFCLDEGESYGDSCGCVAEACQACQDACGDKCESVDMYPGYYDCPDEQYYPVDYCDGDTGWWL